MIYFGGREYGGGRVPPKRFPPGGALPPAGSPEPPGGPYAFQPPAASPTKQNKQVHD